MAGHFIVAFNSKHSQMERKSKEVGLFTRNKQMLCSVLRVSFSA